jgi:hypothetical protein
MLVHSSVASGDLPESAFRFKCSTNNMNRFLKRTRLSLRRIRRSRRPNLDEEDTAEIPVAALPHS